MTGSRLTQLDRLVWSKFNNLFFGRKDQRYLYKETAKLEIREFKTPRGTNSIETKKGKESLAIFVNA